MTTPKIKTHLRNAKVKLSKSGKVESITGQCSERGCKNVRTIKPQDAFQVRFCHDCQKKHLHEKRAEKRRAKRAARKARKQARAKAETKVMASPAARQMSKALEN